MSTASSPRKLAKKQSLSILSSAALNTINNENLKEPVKPTKERVVSETTGLIKFSLKKPVNDENYDGVSSSSTMKHLDEDGCSHENKSKNQLPLYVPIERKNEFHDNKSADEVNNQSESQDENQDLLFQMAAKQRTILELSEKLKQAKEELITLEAQYKSKTMESVVKRKVDLESSKPNTLTNMASSLRKTTSIMNINESTQKQFVKTQKQVTDTLTQFTTNISNANIYSKSKAFFESSLNRNVLIGTELLNSIFEKENNKTSETSTDDSQILMDESNNFDYSVDFDLEKLNKINFDRKLKGTILEDLEEEHDTESFMSNSSSVSENDYGGKVTVL